MVVISNAYTAKAVTVAPDFLGIFAPLAKTLNYLAKAQKREGINSLRTLRLCEPKNNMNLSELKPGQTAIIKDFSDDELSLRFLEMGCIPGEEILMERVAPLGDPIAIRVSGYSLCLRFTEAESILISPTNLPQVEA